MPFNNEQHEKRLAERYERLARYEAFDRLVDMALDGQISLSEAVQEYKTAYEPDSSGEAGTAPSGAA